MFQRILVVCVGNICRSPVAEALLKARLPERQIGSAGLRAKVGSGADPTARALAEAEGVSLADHQAHQLTHELLQQADLILVMSDGERHAIGEMDPTALGKTLRLGRWLEGGKGRDIPDPYRKSHEVFDYVHKLLKDACDAWAAKL